MTDELVVKRVRELVAHFSPVRSRADEIDVNDSFDDLSIDSMSMAELLLEVEQEFGVVATEEELLNQQRWLQTPQSLILFILERFGGASTLSPR